MTELYPRSTGPTDAALLLVMQPGRDRELLAEWLASHPGHAVTTVAPDEPLPREYDLCLVDPRGLERNRSTLTERVDAADPVFLPHLLVTAEEGAERHLNTDDPVDDVVTMPVDQAVLRRRLQNLLAARRASLRLAEREEQYQQLVELTPETLLVVREGEVVYANSAAADTFGVDEPAALHGPVTDFVTPGDRGTLEAMLDTIDREGRLDGFRDLAMLSATGREILAEVAGVTVTFEGESAVQLLVRDVTQRREREQRLSLFGKAIETARQGITIADARQDDEPLIYANAAFEEITGYPAGEVLGRNCRFLQGPGTDEEAVAEVREAIDEQRPVVTELLNYRRDGTPFWNRLEIVPVHDESGEVTHFLGLQRDVTGRREREERLAVLDRVLRHNIRNRMNVIRSRAELLRGQVDGELVDSVDTITGAADDLIAISEQVRKFQSLVSVRDHELEPQDLAATLERAVAGIREADPEAAVQFECPGEAVADVHPTLPAALAQVLEFAVDRSVSPGDADPDIAVRVWTDETSVTIEILDYAGTIPHEDLDAIGRGSETPLQHSRGLELWLIRWAVLTSDGTLTVDTGPSVDDVPGRSDDPVGCLRMRFRRAQVE